MPAAPISFNSITYQLQVDFSRTPIWFVACKSDLIA